MACDFEEGLVKRQLRQDKVDISSSLLTLGTSSESGRKRVPLLGPPTRITALVEGASEGLPPREGT